MMDRNEILNMPAGAEMDMLIAEKIFGWERRRMSGPLGHWWAYMDDKNHEGRSADVWRPSEDIAAAWEVVTHFINTTRERPKIDRMAENEWRVQLNDFDESAVAYSSSAPLAICRAALLAVMGE